MNDKLKQIELAVIEYHDALRRREHGGVAESRCMHKIEDILDIHFDRQHIAKTNNATNQYKKD